MLFELFSLGLGLGGLISGEHGIGRDKQAPYLELTDPTLLALQRKSKTSLTHSSCSIPIEFSTVDPCHERCPRAAGDARS